MVLLRRLRYHGQVAQAIFDPGAQLAQRLPHSPTLLLSGWRKHTYDERYWSS